MDSYAALLTGRLNADGKAIYGRYGYDDSSLVLSPNVVIKNPLAYATSATNYQLRPDVPN